MKKYVVGLSFILSGFNSSVGMYNIIIKNETKREIYIDDCRTFGSFVPEKGELTNYVIMSKEQKNINMRFTSPLCDPMQNYICLSMLSNNEEYIPVLIRWGVKGIYSDNYIVKDLYRLNEDVDSTSIIFSFFEDSQNVIKELIRKTKDKLDKNKSSQQSISEKDVVRCSGIGDQYF